MKLKLTIAYDGSAYQGWQWQDSGTGVQEIIERALAALFPGKPRLHSSSRTDTGVHALGMVAHFELPDGVLEMPVRKLVLAINAHLPEDVRVLAVQRVKTSFHARFDATGKQYRYFIWNHAAMNPLLRGRAWHVKRKLDVKRMREAAAHFVGKQDFRSFRVNPDYDTDSTVRTLTRCDVRRQGAQLTVIIEGDGFLYRMCRGIAGTLVQVGEGKIAPGEIKAILNHRDRRMAGATAPAHGLVLWKVFYEKRRSD